MSILIRGVRYPRSSPLTLIIYPDGTVSSVYDNQRGKAVPVPKHGDLIDRDALEQDAQWRLLECNKYDNQFQKPYEVMRAIALAPTIIQAEEEETT